MAIKGQWEQDKVKNLTSFEDYDIFYFSDATYIDTEETILATFPAFTTGDRITGGSLYRPTNYDPNIDSSIENYPNQIYKDSNVSNRVYMKVISGITGTGELNGNIGGRGTLIEITHTALTGRENSIFRVWKSSIIHTADNTTTTPGEIWLCNTTDDPEYGLNWQDDFEFINDTGSTWSFTIPEWTDADITINKAKFWARDKIGPST